LEIPLKDIFVDNDAATNFGNPLDPHYKEFFKWLLCEGYLVVSQKLLNEYGRTCCGGAVGANIGVIVSKLTIDGRLIVVKKAQLDDFIIPKHIARRLKSNFLDHVHIKAVMLSHRKFAVSVDTRLRNDINNFPKFAACAVDRPEKIGYRE
jgi:hypothetical protein